MVLVSYKLFKLKDSVYKYIFDSPGDGELFLSAYPGVGNRTSGEKKKQIPRGVPKGGGW